jgi:hypothetical protein
MLRAVPNREYLSSVTLIITGEALEPSRVTSSLALEPDQTWRKGESKRIGNDVHEWSGWKKFLPEAVREQALDVQLAHWADLLEQRIGALNELTGEGHQCVLSCFITTDATASIVIAPALQDSVARLNLSLEMSVWAGRDDPEAAS